jgi:hypothetical protein
METGAEMFKLPPFAGVTHLHNGSSVPSIGGVPSLTAALAAVERAETALEAARIQARKAARREGTNTRGLFENSRYILRASGEKWVDEARGAGERAGYEMACKHLELLFDPSIDHDFKHVAERLAIAQRIGRVFTR